MRTEAEITAAIVEFEAQFQQTAIPAGTPNRNALQLAENERCRTLACLPENVATRLALHAERATVRKSLKSKAAAAARKADPLAQMRAWMYRRLRAMGFTRETKTDSGSVYYSCGARTVRISDHEVPYTAERLEARMNGGRTWANNRFSFEVQAGVCWVAAAKWLVEIRREVAAR